VNIDRLSKFGITFLLISMFWLYIFIISIHAVLPNNPIDSLPFERSLQISTWFPQGWGFYSKNPRDPYFMVVDIKSKQLAPNWPNNIPKNIFGLKRLGRSQGMEAGLLHSQIPEHYWKKCSKNPYDCLDRYNKPIEMENKSPNPTLCGDIGFVSQEPVPWAWSNSSEKIEMPSKVARVNVKCSKK
jgi:antimicrobial peptide system SdpA family protein